MLLNRLQHTGSFQMQRVIVFPRGMPMSQWSETTLSTLILFYTMPFDPSTLYNGLKNLVAYTNC